MCRLDVTNSSLEPQSTWLPMRPGQLERRTRDYVRHGTTSLFAALDAKTGKVTGECHRRHRAIEFRRFLQTVDADVPTELDVHHILDNYCRARTRSSTCRQPSTLAVHSSHGLYSRALQLATTYSILDRGFRNRRAVQRPLQRRFSTRTKIRSPTDRESVPVGLRRSPRGA